MPLKRKNTQTHLGLYLDAKLKFDEKKKKKAVKGNSVIKKLNVIVLTSINNKSFIRSHLDSGDVIYDQPNNNGLFEKKK